jgi:hypothetical protein
MGGGAQQRWRCACCGDEFDHLPLDLSFPAPVDPETLAAEERRTLRLDDDFCAVRYASGEVDRFIRCILPIPVPEMEEEFRFGVWISVSAASWEVYEAGFHAGTYAKDTCFGYLMHEIPGFSGSRLSHCDVAFQPGTARPRVFLHESDHPLFYAQRHGVSRAQVEAWVASTHRHRN